jgi:hypothetical protein
MRYTRVKMLARVEHASLLRFRKKSFIALSQVVIYQKEPTIRKMINWLEFLMCHLTHSVTRDVNNLQL